MKKVFGFLSLFLFLNGYSQQKVQFTLKLLTSKDVDASQWLFRVKVINKDFDKYWVQDTTYLASAAETPSLNLIHPLLWRKAGGKFVLYENSRSRSGPLRDKCMDSCCNCIFIARHDSLAFNVKLLTAYKFEKGQYKMQAYINIPLASCNGCEQLPELESNYVFFTIKN